MNNIVYYTSDLHIRDKKPLKRKDEYLEVQFQKLEELVEAAEEEDAPVIIAGDIFDTHSISFKRLVRFTELVSRVDTYVVFGQHDLPNNSMRFWQENPLGLLIRFGTVTCLSEEPCKIGGVYFYGCSWGEEIPIPAHETGNVLVIHELIVKDKPLFEGQEDYVKSTHLLEDYPEYDMILAGDNHKGFIKQKGDQVLLNTGSMMRNNKDQKEHNPHFYRIELDNFQFTKHHFTCEPFKDVFNMEKIKDEERQKETQERYADLISKIKNKKHGHDFKKTLDEMSKAAKLNKTAQTKLKTLLKEAEGV